VDRLDGQGRKLDRVAQAEDARRLVGPMRDEQGCEPADLLHRPHVAQRAVVARCRLVDAPERPTDLERVRGIVSDVEMAPQRHRPAGRRDVRSRIEVADRRRDRQAGVDEEPGEGEAVGEGLGPADETGPGLDPGHDR
jgi:hypothetical protein